MSKIVLSFTQCRFWISIAIYFSVTFHRLKIFAAPTISAGLFGEGHLQSRVDRVFCLIVTAARLVHCGHQLSLHGSRTSVE